MLDMPDTHLNLIPNRSHFNNAPAPLRPLGYPNWPPHPIGHLPAPISPENPINDLMQAPRQPGQQQATNNGGISVLGLTLIALSMLISVTLVIVLIYGSSNGLRRSPLDK